MSPVITARQRLFSYGGASVVCDVASPRTHEELAEQVRAAQEAGRRFTFRATGCAFDTQSLNDDLVFDLGNLAQLSHDRSTAEVTVGPGVTTGALFDAVAPTGQLPRVVVTTERASVIGSAAGYCYSRFSPVHGYDGNWVRSIDLLTADGSVHHLTQEDPDFSGVLGGLGYLGAITKLTMGLEESRHDQVETTVLTKGRIDELVRAARSAANDEARYVVLMDGLERGAVYRSRYVSGEKLRRYAPYQPRSFTRLLGELLMYTHLGARLVWKLGYWTLGTRYVDPIRDFTFFMDGNVRLRTIGRRLGLTMPIVQQTFALPEATIVPFIEEVRRVFRDARLVPMLADVLWCPADRILLSPNYGQSGFVASFAFSPLTTRRLQRARAAFVQLSRRCCELQGRVRLAKNVHAEPEVLQQMYASTLPAFTSIKRRLDPAFRLKNSFLERIFPQLGS